MDQTGQANPETWGITGSKLFTALLHLLPEESKTYNTLKNSLALAFANIVSDGNIEALQDLRKEIIRLGDAEYRLPSYKIVRIYPNGTLSFFAEHEYDRIFRNAEHAFLKMIEQSQKRDQSLGFPTLGQAPEIARIDYIVNDLLYSRFEEQKKRFATKNIPANEEVFFSWFSFSDLHLSLSNNLTKIKSLKIDFFPLNFESEDLLVLFRVLVGRSEVASNDSDKMGTTIDSQKIVLQGLGWDLLRVKKECQILPFCIIRLKPEDSDGNPPRKKLKIKHTSQTLIGSAPQTPNGSKSETSNGSESQSVNGSVPKTPNGSKPQKTNGSSSHSVNGSVPQTPNGSKPQKANGSSSHSVNGSVPQTPKGSKSIKANGSALHTAPPEAPKATKSSKTPAKGFSQQVDEILVKNVLDYIMEEVSCSVKKSAKERENGSVTPTPTGSKQTTPNGSKPSTSNGSEPSTPNGRNLDASCSTKKDKPEDHWHGNSNSRKKTKKSNHKRCHKTLW